MTPDIPDDYHPDIHSTYHQILDWCCRKLRHPGYPTLGEVITHAARRIEKLERENSHLDRKLVERELRVRDLNAIISRLRKGPAEPSGPSENPDPKA